MSDYCKLAPYFVASVFVIPFLSGIAEVRFPEHSNTIQVIKVLATLGVCCLAWWQSTRGQKPGADTKKDPRPASDQTPSA